VTEVARFKRFCSEVLELPLEPFQIEIAVSMCQIA